MTITTITFEVDSDNLAQLEDTYLAQLWHIGQANPAPFGDPAACNLAERLGREIIRRWLAQTGPELWTHQGRHVTPSLAVAIAPAKSLEVVP